MSLENIKTLNILNTLYIIFLDGKDRLMDSYLAVSVQNETYYIATSGKSLGF